MHGMVNIAIKAARRAGTLMIRQLNHLESLPVAEKGHNDFVTQVDQQAEEAIIEVIRDHYPEHAISIVTQKAFPYYCALIVKHQLYVLLNSCVEPK